MTKRLLPLSSGVVIGKALIHPSLPLLSCTVNVINASILIIAMEDKHMYY